jgi:hypothetical protein
LFTASEIRISTLHVIRAILAANGHCALDMRDIAPLWGYRTRAEKRCRLELKGVATGLWKTTTKAGEK